MIGWYKMNPIDWNEGTNALSLEQEASYLRICNAIYIAGGPISANTFVVAGLLRCNERRAKRIVSELAELGKITVENGLICNQRAMNELSNRQRLSVERESAGRRGGIESGKSRRSALKNNDTVEAIASSKTNERRVEKSREEERDKSLSSACAKQTVESIWSMLPKRKRAGTSKPKLTKVVARLLKVGKDPAAILSAVSRCYSEPRHVEEDGQYAPAVYSWLADGVWENWLAEEPAQQSASISDDQWRRMLKAYHDSGSWPPFAGPNPSQPECRVPEPVMARYRAWAEEQAKRSAA